MQQIYQVIFTIFLVTAVIFCCGCVSNTQPENTVTAPVETTKPEVVKSEETQKTLLVYCGAGMKEPMEEIASVYQKNEGTRIEYTFGGSAQLLSQIELYQKGDLYMPGALSYIQSAMEKGYVDKREDVIYHVLTLAVPKGNPGNITGIKDLIRPGVRIAIGEPTGPAVGKAAKKMLEKDKIWNETEKNIVVKSGTVNELLVYIAMDQADVAIIWADLFNPESMNLVEIPMDEGIVDIVPIGTLKFSKDKEEAEKFMNFVSSNEGKEIYRNHGFEIYPSAKYGDA